MSGLTPELPYHNGNGAQHHVPRSRRAFIKSVSPRLAALEDAVGALEDAVEALRLDAGKVNKSAGSNPLIEVRIANLVEHVTRLDERVRVVDLRSARTRRHTLVLADQIAD